MTTSPHPALELPAVSESDFPEQRVYVPEDRLTWSDAAPANASLPEVHGASVQPEVISHDAGAEPQVVSIGFPAPAHMTGRGVVVLALAALGAVAVANVALAQGFTLFFDLCFVVVCLVATMAVSQRDLFTPGVLPPLLLAAVLGAAALIDPLLFGDVQGAYEALMTGLAQHAPALVAGYVVALATLGGRVAARRTG